MELIHGRNLIVLLDGEAIATSDSCEAVRRADTIHASSPLGDEEQRGREEWDITASRFVTTLGGDMVRRRFDLIFRNEYDKQIITKAICTEVRITGTIGKLSKGSIHLKCTGTLHVEDAPRRYFTLNVSKLNGKHVLR